MTNQLLAELEMANKKIEEKDKEIERLKTREEEISKMYLAGHKYASEMEGKYILAKYVIDELEKDIDLELFKTRANDEYNNGLFNAFRYIKDKLKELKEGVNNE